LAAAAVGVGALLATRVRHASPVVDVSPEVSPGAASVGARSVPGSTSAAPADPCSHPTRATGRAPLIDDFEDGDVAVLPLEGRGGVWVLFKDTDQAGSLPLIAPVARPRPSSRNHKALHAVGPELRDWGANLQVDFRPTCYDARAYGGIAFTAKGPGRFYAGVREVGVVPTQWGGTCTHDCYDTHQKKIDLSADWRSYELRWSEFRQRGYAAPPLDPARIHGLAFLVQPGDTPFDLWVDDVRFIPR
jgi:hypothetical protein